MPGAQPRRTCQQCGRTLTPTTRESAKRYAARRFCSRDCANEAQTTIPLAEKNCEQCGQPIERNPKDSRWQHARRRFCSPKCASHYGHQNRASWKPKNGERLAPERYVFNGRFPTPAGLQSTWVTVTGPDATENVAPTKPRHNTMPKSPEITTALRNAIHAHPELAQALAGILTDSWTPKTR